MYYNLKQEIEKRKISLKEFAKISKINYKSFLQKYYCKTDFTLPEAIRIKHVLGGLPIAYIFAIKI